MKIEIRHKCVELNPKSNTTACILIPVYNEGERIRSQIKKMASFSQNIDIIIVDGDSSDNALTFDFLKNHGIMTLLINLEEGKLSRQLQLGFLFAIENQYQHIITIDGNNKDDTTNYTRILEKLQQGYDFIQGSRFVAGGKAINTPKLRKLGIQCIHAPISSYFAKYKYTDTTNGFRGHSAKLISSQKMNIFNKEFRGYALLPHISIFSSRYHFKVCEVPVTRQYPKSGAVPTKISGIVGYLTILKILFSTILRIYKRK